MNLLVQSLATNPLIGNAIFGPLRLGTGTFGSELSFNHDNLVLNGAPLATDALSEALLTGDDATRVVTAPPQWLTDLRTGDTQTSPNHVQTTALAERSVATIRIAHWQGLAQSFIARPLSSFTSPLAATDESVTDTERPEHPQATVHSTTAPRERPHTSLFEARETVEDDNRPHPALDHILTRSVEQYRARLFLRENFNIRPEALGIDNDDIVQAPLNWSIVRVEDDGSILLSSQTALTPNPETAEPDTIASYWRIPAQESSLAELLVLDIPQRADHSAQPALSSDTAPVVSADNPTHTPARSQREVAPRLQDNSTDHVQSREQDTVRQEASTHTRSSRVQTGATDTATIIALPRERSTNDTGFVDFPATLYARYGQVPSASTRQARELFTSLRAEIRGEALDTPYRENNAGQQSPFQSGSSLGIHGDTGQFADATPQELEDQELRQKVINRLQQTGYLGENASEIRELQSVRDGITLTRILADLTPADHDLFDLLEKMELRWNISLGAWCDGHKNMNATLRTFSEWDEREGSKEASLIHPAGNRANVVMQVNDLFEHLSKAEILEFLRIDADTLQRLAQASSHDERLAALPRESILARLYVESEYARLFLQERPQWLERLLAGRNPEYARNHTQRLNQLYNMVDASLAECMQNLQKLAEKKVAVGNN